MSQPFDASKSLATLEQDNTVIAVIEMSQSKWLVAAVVPGVKRQPLKKLQADEEALLKLLYRWRTEAGQTGREIKRVTELLMRAFLGWLRGEKRHCSMAAIPAAEEEDARRPNRERENLVTERTRIANQMKAILARFGIRSFKPTLRKAAQKLDGLRTAEGTPLLENTRAELSRHLARLRVVREQIRAIEQKRLHKLAAAPAEENGPHVMVRLIARVFGVGVETADMLVNEVFARHLRDRKAIARYAGLTGSPDESGKRRRERGLARAGNARVRRGMIQLAWCFIKFQKDSALAKWFDARTADGRGSTRKTMIVALARKLLIALWRLVTTGEVPEGVILRPAA